MNINGSDDPFYRYKMPALAVEHRKNNTTVITNLDEVCKSLSREPEDVMKWFRNALATRVTKNTLSGRLSAEVLQTFLQDYINRFVLCESCGNPETKMKVAKRSGVKLGCHACGHVTTR